MIKFWWLCHFQHTNTCRGILVPRSTPTIFAYITERLGGREDLGRGYRGYTGSSPFCIHTGAPKSPVNISSMVREYRSISSAVEISWNPPLNHDPQVNHYHYELMDRSREPLVMDGIISNASAILEDIPYNHDLMFSLSAGNCVGRSSPTTYHINVGKTNDCHLTTKSNINPSVYYIVSIM